MFRHAVARWLRAAEAASGPRIVRTAKRYPSCRTEKPVAQFGRNSARPDGLQSVCRGGPADDWTSGPPRATHTPVLHALQRTSNAPVRLRRCASARPDFRLTLQADSNSEAHLVGHELVHRPPGFSPPSRPPPAGAASDEQKLIGDFGRPFSDYAEQTSPPMSRPRFRIRHEARGGEYVRGVTPVKTVVGLTKARWNVTEDVLPWPATDRTDWPAAPAVARAPAP